MAGSKYSREQTWQLGAEPDLALSSEISQKLGVSAAMGRLLCCRGCGSVGDAESFLRRDGGALYDPYLLPDMDRAVEIIQRAAAEKRRIVIYGDYDADGVTSVSVLYLYLRDMGADVSYYIPKRSEGYGMSKDAIGKIAADGAGLIITVDTGITAVAETEYARSLGVDVVVTDHHECIDDMPPAYAVVNPQRGDSKYPFSGLAGVGVVFKLVCALETARCPDEDRLTAVMRVSDKYIDLVAIGTIADVMPVLDENRLIVSYGLLKIENTTRPGLRALIDASSDGARRKTRVRVTSSYISFTIAPRINAAGRIADASLAVELFLSDNDARARILADKLCEVNRERQLLENVISEEAYAKIDKDGGSDPVIVVSDEGWHNGIIGIVASRVTEKYGRPSILISFDGAGGEHDIGKGSGRSVKGLNLAQALGECGEYLVKFGGHELAAGLSLERCRLDDFKRAINDVARRELLGGVPEQIITADMELALGEATLEFADEQRLLEPFGVGNPTPLYMTRDAEVTAAVGVGSNKHTRLTLAGEAPITAMCFSASPEELDVYAGERVDILYNIDVNEFRGERTPQLIVRAIRKSESELAREAEDEEIYRKMRASAADACGNPALHIPRREDFAALYRILRHEIAMDRTRHTARGIMALTAGLLPMTYVKVRLALDIFDEMGLLCVRAVDGGAFELTARVCETKIRLDQSRILSALHAAYGG